MNDDGNQSPRLESKQNASRGAGHRYLWPYYREYPHQYLIGQQLFDLLD